MISNGRKGPFIVKKRSLWVLLVVLSLLVSSVLAEAFHVEDYSYEELLTIQSVVNEKIDEMERQYAIENGNRKIVFEQSEYVLYEKGTLKLTPEVQRVVDDAPEKTQLVWESSDKAVATVTQGTITAKQRGQVTITCSAKDDPLIFSAITVNVLSHVSSVEVDQPTLELLLKEGDETAASASLHVTISPEHAECQTVHWSSSDETVATVDALGNVTAIGPGTATITAVSDDDVKTPKQARCKVTVTQAVSSIEIAEQLVLDQGKRHTLEAKVLPENASKQTIHWSSSDESVATVTSQGVISAKGGGTCVITGEAADGHGAKVSIDLQVIRMVSSISLGQSKTVTLSVGKTLFLPATIKPDDATNKAIVWSSSNDAIATVKQLLNYRGHITANAPGDCEITCQALDGSEAQATISVHVSTLACSNTKLMVKDKKGYRFKIQYYNDGSVSFRQSSSNYFDAEWVGGWEGNSRAIKITPKRAGTATLTFSDNSGNDTLTLGVTIDHSAVYDSIGYPQIEYKDAFRYPDQYSGDNVSFSGKVLQVVESNGQTILRVSSRGNWDNVVYVAINTSDLDIPVLEDDKVTVYGTYAGNYTYSSIWNQSITIPSVKGEKITIN